MRNWLFILFLVVTILFVVFRVYSFGKEPALEGEKNISEKLDQVLKNQEDIITRLEDVRKQLDIIKVRASTKR